jgi:hypothetical protein
VFCHCPRPPGAIITSMAGSLEENGDAKKREELEKKKEFLCGCLGRRCKRGNGHVQAASFNALSKRR